MNISRIQITILEGYKVKRTILDRHSFTSNEVIRFKMKHTKNPVTRSVYRQILRNRPFGAIQDQFYFSGKRRKFINYGN